MSEQVRRPRTATQDFVRLLWQQPLWALPFALFFWVVGRSLSAPFLDNYKTSLVFTCSVRLSLWAAAHFIVPRLGIEPGNLSDRRRWGIGLYYIVSGLVGSLVAGLIV